MGCEINMREDGVLQVTFRGIVDAEEIEAYVQAYQLYRERATEENPVRFLGIGTDLDKFTSGARKALIDMFQARDPRAGKTALVGGSRYGRVLAGLVIKATGRDDMRLFGTVEEAEAWLKSPD